MCLEAACMKFSSKYIRFCRNLYKRSRIFTVGARGEAGRTGLIMRALPPCPLKAA